MADITDEQIAAAVRPLYADDTAASMGLADDIRTARAVLALQPSASAEPVQQWPDILPKHVAVSYSPSDWDTFIYGVSGHLTMEALANIDKQIRDEDAESLFDKGPGDYLLSASRFNGQYSPQGQCEFAPGWELSVEQFRPLEASPPPVTAAREQEASATGAEPVVVEARTVHALCESIEQDQRDDDYTRGMRTMARRIRKEVAALATPTTSTTGKVDVEQMLRDCVPGGSSCDPQAICDDIRNWFARGDRS